MPLTPSQISALRSLFERPIRVLSLARMSDVYEQLAAQGLCVSHVEGLDRVYTITRAGTVALQDSGQLAPKT